MRAVYIGDKRLVVAAAIIRDGALLAARRIEPPELAGGWELPGGKVEAGESPEQALRREIYEELVVDVELVQRIGGNWPLGERHVMQVWVCSISSEAEPIPAEQHDDLLWVDESSFRSIPWLDGDVAPALEALKHL